MEIIVVGINYKQSPIEIREKVAFTKSSLEKAYGIFKENHFIKEAVILSTCNRSEITAVAADVEKGVHELVKFYHQFFELADGTLTEHLFIKVSDDAVKHIFHLSAGLDSLILGEDQILGQVREAHSNAKTWGCTDTILNKLYREAITTAKKIKRTTAISQNSLSISSIAVKFVEQIFGDLKDKRVMVIGVGKMSRIAIENLIYKGVKEIYVTNRTKGHAVDLSKRYNEVGVIDFHDRYKMISQVDIIITSTSAPHYVLRKEAFEKYLGQENKICIIDIAVPRDVDPEIGEIQNVSLYELDDLKRVSMENMESRVEAAKHAGEIIIEECIKFENWYHCLPVFPVLEALAQYREEILEEEVKSLMPRLEQASEKDKELIEIVMRSLAKKIIRKPILNLKRAGEDRQGELYASIAGQLFGVNQYSCKPGPCKECTKVCSKNS
ncbi:glutamyl-tRNA reductase [Anaerosolibacter carboniphilus]|uniref:Glutamyl-tRNA reductase n=1 Tax=Anaerosolibacter carboniphilus TaxID=1417629 RepID=A0A841KL66_9FIRM|nr:glutamyl-tRNA reductase [Anaerosolibacter carboniphilus]MBB6214594.1 glutamyl-tRNA reductase [Anaerosolibacter carboniphilus]